MADIDIAVDSGDLKAAIDLLGRLGDDFVKTTNQIQTQSNRMVRASKASADQIDQAFNKIVGDKLQRDINQAKGYWQSYDQALGVTGKRATEVGASFSALEKEINSLTQKYNPLAAATDYYNKEVNNLNRTHQLGIITSQQLENHLNRLEREYESLSKGVYLAGSRFNQFGEMSGVAGRSANRFGMYAQQAGYQLGDFAVQVQAGTNVGVAFSQQFAQLAGLIPGVAGAVATFGAIGLGLLIQNMTRSSKEVEQAKEKITELGRVLDELNGIQLNDALLSSVRGVREEFEATLAIMEKIKLAELKEVLDSPLKPFRDQLSNYNPTSDGMDRRMGRKGMEIDFFGIKDLERAIAVYQHLSQIQGETKEELAASLELQTRYLRGSGLLTPELEKHLSIMGEQIGVQSIINKNAEEEYRLREEVRNAIEGTSLTAENLLNVLEAISGVDISGVFDRASDSANRLLDTVNAVGRGLSQLGRLGMEAQVLQATQNALQDGATPGEARVAGDTVRYGQSLEGVPAFLKPFMTKAFETQQLDNLRYNEEISNRGKTSGGGSSGRGKSGSGGSGRGKLSEAEKAQDKLKEFFEEFKEGMEQQERLLGVYGEQREELEKVIEIENRLGDARHLVSQKQIEAMANEELALERKLQREQEIYNMGNQNVENLLMTIVSGTASIEDAFKGMLANIISEVYQQYVAKGAANMAGNAIVSLFSAKGNAFGAGGVKMFANGGVVDSPTLFNYSGGKTGMMGEAGPEAIMPLKRNSQGRLGVEVSGNSSNPINISNVFNLSANGDESVNRIIQAQIPKITEASTRAVIEAKRRNVRGL